MLELLEAQIPEVKAFLYSCLGLARVKLNTPTYFVSPHNPAINTYNLTICHSHQLWGTRGALRSNTGLQPSGWKSLTMTISSDEYSRCILLSSGLSSTTVYEQMPHCSFQSGADSGVILIYLLNVR